MIDLNKIRSLKTLEGMRKDLNDFLTFDRATIVAVYNEQFDWDEEDYDADCDSAKDLLEAVERRIKSLGHHLNKKQKVKVSEDKEQSGGAVVHASSP